MKFFYFIYNVDLLVLFYISLLTYAIRDILRRRTEPSTKEKNIY